MMPKLTVGMLAVIIVLQAVVLSGQADELNQLRKLDRFQGSYGEDILRAVDDLEDELRINQDLMHEMGAAVEVMNLYGVQCDPI